MRVRVRVRGTSKINNESGSKSKSTRACESEMSKRMGKSKSTGVGA